MLHDILGPVAVVHVPVDYQDPLQAECAARIQCRNRHVTNQAEAHPAACHRVVPRWTHCAERAIRHAGHNGIHGGEHRAGSGSCGIPASRADHGLGIQLATAGLCQRLDKAEVAGRMGQLEFRLRGVASLELHDGHEQLRVAVQGSRDGAQSPHMLGVVPAGVVRAAVAVGDKRDRHGLPQPDRVTVSPFAGGA